MSRWRSIITEVSFSPETCLIWGYPLKVSEIESESTVPEIVVRVISMGPPRLIVTRGGRRTQLREVLVGDESGTVVLVLWGFGMGDDLTSGTVIRITNAWGKSWQGQKQLTLGRNGSYEIIEDDGSIPPVNELVAKHGKAS